MMVIMLLMGVMQKSLVSPGPAAHNHPPLHTLVTPCLGKCGPRVGVSSPRAHTDVWRL